MYTIAKNDTPMVSNLSREKTLKVLDALRSTNGNTGKFISNGTDMRLTIGENTYSAIFRQPLRSDAFKISNIRKG